MASTRQSNIELCRIFSILLVMLVHTGFQSLGWETSSWGVMLLEAFTIIGVNVFVLITGYFSTEPKKISLINLLFLCFFWMVIKVVIRYSLGQHVGLKDFFFITNSNWFIPSYICLLFLTPILNMFCNSVNENVLRWGVIALLFIEMWFDLLPPHPAVSLGSQHGYSVLSFVILYLLARYIRLYGVPNWFRRWSFSIYLICTFLLVLLAFAFLRTGHPFKNVYAYSNPVVIVSSVSFLLTFEKLKMGENRLINHIAKSTLAALFGHVAIFSLYKEQFYYIYFNFTGIRLACYWALSVIIVFCASIAIDQLRLLMWKPIEMQLRKRINKNELF